MAFDRNKMKEDILKRTKEAPQMGRGSFGRSFFKEGLEDKGVKFWQCGAGDHLLDIIPYEAGKWDPNPEVKEGDYAFFLIVQIHNNVGPTKDRVVCPAWNYKRPCPICEAWQEAKDAGDEARMKELRPQQVVVYNILCWDNEKETAKGVQVWSVAHWNFQRFLDVLSKSSRQGGVIPYADADSGSSIAFTRQGTKRENTVYLGHRFETRDYVIRDEWLQQAWCLDDLLDIRTYEDLYESFYGEKYEGPAKSAASPRGEAPAPARVAQARRPEPPAQETTGRGASDRGFPARQSSPDPIPPTRQAPPPTRQAPPPAQGADNKCPVGGRYGEDTDQLDGCRTCDVYDNCAREAERLEAERKSKLSQGGPSRRRALT